MSIDMVTAIEALREKSQQAAKSEDALRFSQAATNLANARASMVHTDKLEKS
jgi:hypothetical protein